MHTTAGFIWLGIIPYSEVPWLSPKQGLSDEVLMLIMEGNMKCNSKLIRQAAQEATVLARDIGGDKA